MRGGASGPDSSTAGRGVAFTPAASASRHRGQSTGVTGTGLLGSCTMRTSQTWRGNDSAGRYGSTPGARLIAAEGAVGDSFALADGGAGTANRPSRRDSSPFRT